MCKFTSFGHGWRVCLCALSIKRWGEAVLLRTIGVCGLLVLEASSIDAGALRRLAVSDAVGRPVYVDVPEEFSQEHSGRAHTIDRIGNHGYIFRVRPGDVWLREAPTNIVERSELSHRTRWPISKDFWFAFRMTVLSGLPSQARWAVIGQLHSSPNSGDGRGSPPWAQVIFPGRRFAIQIRHSSERPLLHNPPPITLFTDPALREGRRYDFVYRVRYDPVGGALDAWRDGRRIATYQGPLGYPADVGPYLKFGIYRARAEGELDVAFDNIRTGERLCDVADPRRLPDLPVDAAVCKR